MLFSHTLNKLALRLLGFSTAIFTEFCKIETGNSEVGWLVKNNLKSRWTEPDSEIKSSNVCSNVFKKPTDKWQFYKTAQLPLSANCWINYNADFSIPLPSDKAYILRPILIVSAKVIKSLIGSAISFSKNRIGLMFVESLNDFSKLNVYGWLYSLPKIFPI